MSEEGAPSKGRRKRRVKQHRSRRRLQLRDTSQIGVAAKMGEQREMRVSQEREKRDEAGEEWTSARESRRGLAEGERARMEDQLKEVNGQRDGHGE